MGPIQAQPGPNRGPTGAQPGPTWNAARVVGAGYSHAKEIKVGVVPACMVLRMK